MSHQLVRYEAARAALEAATKIDEVKSIHDKAVAVAAYAKQAKDTDMINWAVEIKVRAERRAGELLKAMPKNEGAKGVGTSAVPKKNHTPTLAQQGISKKESMTWQKLADIPAPVFEKKLIAVKAQGEKLATKAVLAAKKPMSSVVKEEPDMGLDVIETMQKLAKRWPGKHESLMQMVQVALNNWKKGTLWT